MKKHVLRVLGLALALIAAGCANPLNEDLSAPIAGKGVVAVSVGPGARTLLPNAAALYYTLVFTSEEKTVSGAINSGAAGSFALDAGTWSLVVTGYLNEAASTNEANAVAHGNAGGIVVSAGQTTQTTVELSALISEGQSGTLSYDIAFPSAVTVAVLTARLTSGEPVSVDLLDNVDQSTETDDGVTTVEGTLSLSVGYHEVSVYLYGDSLGRLMKLDTAHIYKGLITTLVENFTSGNFSAGPDVAALNAALGAAQTARDDIGLLGEEAAAVTALDAAIVAAEAARDDTLATQPEVDAAVTALTTATEAFNSAKAAAQTTANQQAANSFTTTHAAALALTVDNVAITDKTAVQAALTAYGNLAGAVQALLTSEKALLDNLSAKITELETAAANQQTANSFRNDHSAVLAKTPTDVAITDKDAVNAALTAHGNLTDAVKALLTSEKALLDSLSAKITELETAANADPADVQAANSFRTDHSTVLAKTPTDVAITDKDAVNAALTAHGNLTDAVKALLTSEKALLDSLSAKITELEIAATNQQTANSFKTDHSAVLAKTPTDVAITDKDAVNAALTAHGNLTDAVKALLAPEKALLDNLSAKITQLETAAAEAAAAYGTAHTAALALTVDNVAITDKEAVEAALSAFNDLSEAAKALLGSEKDKLDSLKAKIADLEAAEYASDEELSAAAAYRITHTAALALTVDNVAIANKEAVEAALSAFNDLSEAVQALLGSEKGKLDSLKAKIDLLGTGGVTVSFSGLPQDETINLSGSETALSWTANTTITFTVSGTFSAYAWDVDGKPLASATTNTLTLHAQGYSKGTHTVTAKVSKDGMTWSKRAKFSIGE